MYNFPISPTPIKRHTFKDLSHVVQDAFINGELVPMGTPIEVLPGDRFKIGVNSFVRMIPTVNVPFNNIYMNIWFFYVPSRIVWTHWKEFVGENTNDPWTATSTYTVPKIMLSNSAETSKVTTADNSILSHMGVRNCAITNGSSTSYAINALPVRMYCEIWNTYFRDTNYQYPILYTKGDSSVYYTGTAQSNRADSATGHRLLPLNRIPDYFSTGIPDPSFGLPVRLPVNTDFLSTYSSSTAPKWAFLSATGSLNRTNIYVAPNSSAMTTGNTLTAPQYLAGLPTDALGTIEQFRIAYLTQQYQYSLGIFGQRYQDITENLFGVMPTDSTIDIPLLIGYHSFKINVSPVVQTSASEDVTLSSTTVTSVKGSVSGYSATGDRSNYLFDFKFKEWGYIIPLYGTRIERSYSQGLHKIWRKFNFLDYYNKYFDSIGPQARFRYELSMGLGNPLSGSSVWNYNEAWLDYKVMYNQVVGILSSSSLRTYWTLADIYSTDPTFSDSWLAEGYTNLNRTLSTTSDGSTTPQFLADFFLDIVTTRAMSFHSLPSLVGRL